MPDGRLLHLRDTYPIETAWAPQYVGDELRQVRAAAWDARLAGLRAAAEARAAGHRGDHDHAAAQHKLAAGYQALERAYRQRETVFAQTMADRADWDKATRAQRQLAVAADAELRRRHPGQYFSPLRSAEPEPATQAQRDDLTLTPDQPPGEIDQWITDLAAGHRTFAGQLADRQSQTIPSEDPDYGDLGPAFPAWTSPRREPILQPPKPEIPPSPQILAARDRPRRRLGSRGLTVAGYILKAGKLTAMTATGIPGRRAGRRAADDLGPGPAGAHPGPQRRRRAVRHLDRPGLPRSRADPGADVDAAPCAAAGPASWPA